MHGELASCPLPPLAAQMGTRLLSLTHDGGGLWSAPAALTVFNSATAPAVTSFTPWLVSLSDPPGTEMTLLGSNFAPLASFACVFLYADHASNPDPNPSPRPHHAPNPQLPAPSSQLPASLHPLTPCPQPQPLP